MTPANGAAALPRLSGVLTPPEMIKLAKWCAFSQVNGPSVRMARTAFPTLKYRKAETIQAALDFFRDDTDFYNALVAEES